MSTTPRSTRSSSSRITSSAPPWRSLSKKRAPTSLSLVVATPEAGAPLASASSRLLPPMDEGKVNGRRRNSNGSSRSLQQKTIVEEDGGAKSDPVLAETSPPPLSESPAADFDLPREHFDDSVTVVVDSIASGLGHSVDGQANAQEAASSPETSNVHEAHSTSSLPDSAVDSRTESGPPGMNGCAQPVASTSTAALTSGPAASRSSWFASFSRARSPGAPPLPKPSTETLKSIEEAKPDSADRPEAEPSSEAKPSLPSPPPESVPTPTVPASTAPTPIETASEPAPAAAPPALNIVPPTPPRFQHPSRRPSISSSIPSTPTKSAAIPTKRSWFGSSTTSFPSQPAAPATPPPPCAPTPPPQTPTPNAKPLPSPAADFPSPVPSIDDAVPPTGTPTLPPQAQGSVSSENSNKKLASLNPSSSRFALSIPLLGRPKVPLEKVLKEAAVEVERKGDKDGETPAPADSPPVSTDAATVPAPSPSNETLTSATDDSSASANESKDSPPHKHTPSQSSWWSYVGWSETTSTANATPSAELEPEARANTDAEPSQEPSIELESPVPEPQSAKNVEDQSPVVASDSTESPTPTAQQSTPSSTWLSSWAWYSTPAPVPVPSTEQQPESEAAPPAEQAPAEPPTPAAPERPPSPAPAPEEQNPIQTTMYTHRTGWASFFSSRKLVAKTISSASSVHSSHSGMEVMDLDMDEGDAQEKKDGSRERTGRARAESAGSLVVRPQMQLTKARPPSPARSPPAPVSPKLAPSKAPAVSKKKSKHSPRPSVVPPPPPPPNLVLPTFGDTFRAPPRSLRPAAPSPAPSPSLPAGALSKTVQFVSGLFGDEKGKGKQKQREASTGREEVFMGEELPRVWDVLGQDRLAFAKQCKRVVVIGIHGWFPGAVMRTVLGEPTGTSVKFTAMMCQALDAFQERHGLKFDRVTGIPLEGEGTIGGRVERLYVALMGNAEWVADLHAADAVLVATHSQGSIVSTHLLDRLIAEGHVVTPQSAGLGVDLVSGVAEGRAPQRVCCLALCGIHLGPLKYLSSSSLLGPYIQYFESQAARELFEFQNTENEVSKRYVAALSNVLNHGTKMVYIASLNDQVVPLYSGVFTAASHPLILRALYIDGDAYHSSDFLSNLLVLLMRILNTGLSDSGLIAHLSEATAGSLSGVGHSTAYEEMATYSLAVDYLFLTDDGADGGDYPELIVDDFNATGEQNDYEIPWSLRDLIANPRVTHFFGQHFSALRDAFPVWQPRTTILRDVKRKLQPIQRLNLDNEGHAQLPRFSGESALRGGTTAKGSVSKL